MAFEKRYTAKQVAEAVLKATHELLAKSELAKAETKHARCVEHVKQNSPGVSNPHAVCVAEGVRPGNWKKSEDLDKNISNLCTDHMIKSEGYGLVKSEMDKCHTCGMQKSGASAEEAKSHLIKCGLSPNQVRARMKKYETMMSPKLGYKPSEIGSKEIDQERTDKDYEVHPDKPANALGPKSPASHSHPEVQKSEMDRLRGQVAPGNNPKEQAEGNNELAGTTPTQVGQDGKNIPGGDEIKSHLKLAKFIGRMEYKRLQKKNTMV